MVQSCWGCGGGRGGGVLVLGHCVRGGGLHVSYGSRIFAGSCEGTWLKLGYTVNG